MTDITERLRESLKFAPDDDTADALAEIDRLREANKRLNSRCQQYESGLAEKWTMGGGLGRALANAAAAMYKAENENLRVLLSEAAADLAIQCDHDHQFRDKYPDEMRRYKRDMDLPNRITAVLRG